MGLALHVAGWSKDQSTKVGAVVVGPDNEVRTLGFNGMPRGVDDRVTERHVRPEKYCWFEHGERNAFYNAARVGIPTNRCTLYIASFPAKFGPCDECCRAIIQCGIERVVTEIPQGDIERWRESFRRGSIMLAERGVMVTSIRMED